MEALDAGGGIVEEMIDGDVFRSPSVQLRISPAGAVDVMSTHDQVLGGANGMTYFGCYFPADPGDARRLAGGGLRGGRGVARGGAGARAAGRGSPSPRSSGELSGGRTRPRSPSAAAGRRPRSWR